MSKNLRFALLILIAAAFVSSAWAQDNSDRYADIIKSRTEDGGFVLGDPEAQVKVIEFSDFLCHSCQNYEPLVASFVTDYVLAGQAQFEYRIFPVIDPVLSVQSASLVECADTLQPGLFWRAHDLMFELVTNEGFTQHSIDKFAGTLGLEPTALDECVATAKQHEIDAAYGFQLGVSGTPSLFVQYGDAAPTRIALPLPEHFPAIINAMRPQTTDPVVIEFGDYAGLTTFRHEDGGFVLGEPSAPVTIVAFEDFLCPHCQTYTATVKQFIDEQVRAGRAKYEFRFYPLVNPQHSTTFAKISECVALQDLRLFWDAHDLLFQFAGAGNLVDIPEKLAGILDLDAAALEACLSGAVQFLIDTQLGQEAHVTGTPAVRAREDGGPPQIIHTGQQPQDRGGLPLELLNALIDQESGVSIGAPEPSMLDDSFLRDESLLTGEPCAPPCWQDIRPGETDMTVAIEAVAGMQEMAIVQAADTGFVFQYAGGTPCCQIASGNDGTVVSILLQFAPTLELGQVIDVYGEPDYVSGQPFSAKEAAILLYFTEHNMLLYVMVAGVDGQLEETSPVLSAVYATDELLEAAFGATPFDHWKGYLTYSEYMDGQFDHQP